MKTSMKSAAEIFSEAHAKATVTVFYSEFSPVECFYNQTSSDDRVPKLKPGETYASASDGLRFIVIGCGIFGNSVVFETKINNESQFQLLSSGNIKLGFSIGFGSLSPEKLELLLGDASRFKMNIGVKLQYLLAGFKVIPCSD